MDSSTGFVGKFYRFLAITFLISYVIPSVLAQSEIKIPVEKEFRPFVGYILSMDISANNRYLLMAGRQKVSTEYQDLVMLWDMQTNIPVRSYFGGNYFRDVVFFDQERQIACTEQNSVSIWDRETGRLIRSLSHEGIYALAANNSGTRLVSGGYNREVRLWDGLTGDLLRTFNVDDQVVEVDFSPDEKHILVRDGSMNGNSYLFDADNGNLIRRNESEGQVIFAADGQSYLEGHNLRDLETGNIRSTFSMDEYITWESLSPNAQSIGQWVVLINNLGRQYVYSADRSEPLFQLDNRVSTYSVLFTTDCRKIVLGGHYGSDAMVNVYDLSPYQTGTPTDTPLTGVPETPTETPTATPTPTSTINPKPVTDLSAWPNLSAEFVTMYGFYDSSIAVDPRNQDLYFFKELNSNRNIIIGPIPPGQSIPEDFQSLIYADLPVYNNQSSSPRGFFMTPKGVMYIHFYGQIFRIPAKGQVENFIPEGWYDRMYSPDLYEVKEGDLIPRAKPEDIIVSKVQSTANYSLFEVELYALDPKINPPQSTLLGKTILSTYTKGFSIGPDRHLYLANGTYGYGGSTFELYRFELNGSFTQVARTNSGLGDIYGLSYWPKDQSFYFYANMLSNMEKSFTLWRLNPQDGSLLRIFDTAHTYLDIKTYQNGEKLLVMDRDWSRQYADAFVESLSLNAPFPTPTGTFVPQPFATPLPADYPTPTQTATPTPTATATPIVPQTNLENYKADLLMTAASYPFLLAVHPKTGEWYLAQNYTTEDIGGGFVTYHDGIFKLDPPDQYMGRYIVSSTPDFTMPRGYWGSMYDLKVGSDGTVAVSYIPGKHSTPKIRINRPNAPELDLEMGLRTQPVFVVNDTSRIPFAQTGDVLVGSKIIHSSSTEATNLELEDTILPDYLVDFCEGPDGKLFFLFYDKIFYVDDQGQPREWLHFTIPDRPSRIEYNPLDASFYVTFAAGYSESKGHILRISEHDRSMQHILITTMRYVADIIAIPGQNGFYTLFDGEFSYSREVARVINSNAPVLPTPTSSVPSPTPTPIKGWFVLDGLGGIHSTNPSVPRPVLPYWPEFNIARDIEPDPLGRGWYMLDGFGGIHTSSPDLPRPDSLPYFGFDVARNLEVKLKDGKLEFYLLDGYGVIHTTDVTLPWDSSIWFGADIARDLNPAPNSDEWMVMDVFGNLFQGMPPKVDTIRMVHHSLISPVMRSFVRFPDETTVMVDLFGGRHTNPFHPAANVANGLPDNFYFPGWDIIRDLEVVPENLSEKRP